MSTSFCNLSGLRALVTGSSSGIGRAVALALAQGGADVLVHCNRSLDGANDTSAQCQALGRRSAVLVANFEATAGAQTFVETAWSLWRGLELLVHCAGADLLTGQYARLDYDAKLRKLLEVDVNAGVLIARGLGQHMRNAGGGVVLTIGWDQAACGMAGDSGELFATAKNAVMGFTRSLALSLAPAVRVNCIAPGWVRTAWGFRASASWQERVRRETPLARWGEPAEVAALARFLCSREASFITGQIINVNGGAVR